MIHDTRCGIRVMGYGIRDAGYELRDTRCGMLDAGHGLRVMSGNGAKR
ncbi:MAG: hypothetical protein PHP79_07760 [Clostridia bacterium]|nr:hypothetical protein [Clostridia bacterium]